MLNAIVDPIAKTITIPAQTSNRFVYTSTGTYKIGTTKQSEVDVSYSITGPRCGLLCTRA